MVCGAALVTLTLTLKLHAAHFKDQDALSARIIQARFTGHFRFACRVRTLEA